jgi:hypothetical protein
MLPSATHLDALPVVLFPPATLPYKIKHGLRDFLLLPRGRQPKMQKIDSGDS